MPRGVVTVTSTTPVPVGDTAVIEVSEFTVKELAAILPKETLRALVKLEPVIVTVVPPVVRPVLGEIPDTTGPVTGAPPEFSVISRLRLSVFKTLPSSVLMYVVAIHYKLLQVMLKLAQII